MDLQGETKHSTLSRMVTPGRRQKFATPRIRTGRPDRIATRLLNQDGGSEREASPIRLVLRNTRPDVFVGRWRMVIVQVTHVSWNRRTRSL